MKITTATYETTNGTLTINSDRFDVFAEMNAKPVQFGLNRKNARVFPRAALNEGEVGALLWNRAASLFKEIHGHRGTNSDVRDLLNELRRFA